jgi:bifunctional non-homologous end joining protein LigD
VTLARYQSKRDFTSTGEPAGGGSTPVKRRSRSRFIIQKHAATRLHYDFRLEMEGVLKSWAVPKGFPTVRGEKRLAMHVEDHPIEYGSFEGTIPPGNYGAGTVMLWDKGTYEMVESDPGTALRKGKLVLRLDGRKLKGHWTLVRMRSGEDREENAWLLLKTGEDVRAVSTRADDRSVKSNRTMHQLATRSEKVWKSNRSSAIRRSRPGSVRASARRTARRPARN